MLNNAVGGRVDWRSHIVFGIAIGLLGVFLYNAPSVLVPLTALFSLMPDIDHPKSVVRLIFDICAAITAVVVIYWWVSKQLLSHVVVLCALVGYVVITRFMRKNRLFRHRGITHSLVACSVVMVCAYASLGMNNALFIGMAYYSHLFLDGLGAKIL